MTQPTSVKKVTLSGTWHLQFRKRRPPLAFGRRQSPAQSLSWLKEYAKYDKKLQQACALDNKYHQIPGVCGIEGNRKARRVSTGQCVERWEENCFFPNSTSSKHAIQRSRGSFGTSRETVGSRRALVITWHGRNSGAEEE